VKWYFRGSGVANAAIHYESEAFDVGHAKPMGRHFAGFGFISAFARHAANLQITGLVRNAAAGQDFSRFIKGLNPAADPRVVLHEKPADLARVGCLFTPATINASQAWTRELHGARSWSLCGVNHTLSSDRTMDAVTEWLTLPIQPWDAVICTSTVSRNVIVKLLERQAEYLRQRVGATRFVTPQLPVIPLGVDCDAQAGYAAHRDQARAELGLAPDEVVVLFLGRLSFHAKANPAPMYLALERLAKKHRLVLVECGWAASDLLAQALEAARGKLCPSVRAIVLDGRKQEERTKAWAAADIFCSLSDNIQETFGLTPIEAMAAGLPVVVTDWDGYKDTVRNGTDGFAVPTLAAPGGAGLDLAIRYALDVDNYDIYIGQASLGVSVDIDATAAAIDRLASDAELRRQLGANGAARAREVYDWKVIVRAYENLWDRLERIRQEGVPSPASGTAASYRPARPDPYDLFASFPSSILSLDQRVRQAPDVSVEEVKERLQLKVALVDSAFGTTVGSLAAFWLELGVDGLTVRTLLAKHPKSEFQRTIRSLLWLTKFGLAKIDNPPAEA
jgi:glycosyltransferase involved in cell wall biosynthesis